MIELTVESTLMTLVSTLAKETFSQATAAWVLASIFNTSLSECSKTLVWRSEARFPILFTNLASTKYNVTAKSAVIVAKFTVIVWKCKFNSTKSTSGWITFVSILYPWAWWAKLAYQVMLTIRGRLITPFVLGSMSVGLNILICHSFMDLWFWITALVPWPQLLLTFMWSWRRVNTLWFRLPEVLDHCLILKTRLLHANVLRKYPTFMLAYSYAIILIA